MLPTLLKRRQGSATPMVSFPRDIDKMFTDMMAAWSDRDWVDTDTASYPCDSRLREDLYYRLNVIPIDLPPLRERAGDIALLASFAMHRVAAMNSKAFTKLSASCIEKLSKYAWPGNVRQLLHTIERAVIMNDGNALDAEMVVIDDGGQPVEVPQAETPASNVAIQSEEEADQPPFTSDQIVPLGELERLAIIHALGVCNGSPGVAAKKLGISPATIYRKIKAYGISSGE